MSFGCCVPLPPFRPRLSVPWLRSSSFMPPRLFSLPDQGNPLQTKDQTTAMAVRTFFGSFLFRWIESPNPVKPDQLGLIVYLPTYLPIVETETSFCSPAMSSGLHHEHRLLHSMANVIPGTSFGRILFWWSKCIDLCRGCDEIFSQFQNITDLLERLKFRGSCIVFLIHSLKVAF